MKALTYAGLPTHQLGHLSPVPAAGAIADVEPTPSVSVKVCEDLLALALGAVRGRVHRRVEERGTAYLIQPEDDWTVQLLEAVAEVLAQDDPRATRDALTELGALAAEWHVAINRTTKGQP